MIYGIWSGLIRFRRYYKNLDIENSVSLTDGLTHSPLTKDSIWNQQTILIIVIIGFCFSANQIIWSWSLEHSSIANSTILHNLTPIFTALGAYLFLNQRFDTQFILGMLVAIAGAAIIGVKDLSDLSFGFSQFAGDLAALASAVFYSLYLVAIEKLDGKLDIVTIVLACCALGSIIVFPLLLIEQYSVFPHTFNAWFSVIALAIVCQGIGQALIAYSLKTIPSGVVALLHLLCPCMSAIEAWLIFNQALSLENLIGFMTILTGLYVGLSSTATRT